MSNNNTSMDRKALGLALRALRERAGMTQKELASGAGTGHTYVSRVEAGRIDAGWSSVRRLLRALDATPRQLADAITRAEREEAADKP